MVEQRIVTLLTSLYMVKKNNKKSSMNDFVLIRLREVAEKISRNGYVASQALSSLRNCSVVQCVIGPQYIALLLEVSPNSITMNPGSSVCSIHDLRTGSCMLDTWLGKYSF